MVPQRRAAQRAEVFDESYPDSLPLRLAWLADHLRIERARFLRLMVENGCSIPRIKDYTAQGLGGWSNDKRVKFCRVAFDEHMSGPGSPPRLADWTAEARSR